MPETGIFDAIPECYPVRASVRQIVNVKVKRGSRKVNNIQELQLDELEQVDGGIVPIVLAAAVAMTAVEFSFIAGVFDGIAASASRSR